jgi:glycosyltransferase involved in cell wall biosynthesis
MTDKANVAEAPNAASSKQVTISLCLLTWNEIDGCRSDVPRLPRDTFQEVFAVDGGSTDGTVEYLASQGITVHRQPKHGYNQAYIHAMECCTSDALALYHPKGNIDPHELLKFRPLLEAGNDLVIASRMSVGARNEEDDRLIRPRKWFVLSLALIAAALWRRKGPIVWDVLHGLRAMRRRRFFAIEPLQTGLSIDLELVVRSYRLGFRIAEFPVREWRRAAGKTHFQAIPTGLHLVRYLWNEIKRPGSEAEGDET